MIFTRLHKFSALSAVILAQLFAPACVAPDCDPADAFCEPLNGYLLYTDPIPTALRIYWVRRNGAQTVARANLDGSAVENLGGTFPGSPNLALVDGPGGFFYYNIDGSMDVRRMRLDGSGDSVFVTDDSAGDPLGLAIDRSRDRLYFWNAAAELRYVSIANGGGQTVLRALTAGQTGGFYSAAEDVIYSAGGTDLRRVSADGATDDLLSNSFTGVLTVIAGGDGTLYVVDFAATQIVRVNRDGSNPQVVLSGFQPGGVAFDSRNNHLYVCDQTNQRIFRANELGGDLTPLVSFEAGYNPIACNLQFTAGGLF
ncbi:MAG: hypothetical protein NXI24_07480 [bacterium]|nr:hypothetical protein [bacterium]